MTKVKKYRRLPEIIEAVEFLSNEKEWPKGIDFDPDDGSYGVWNDLHQIRIKFKHGDFIRMDNPQDRYPIDRETFHRTYEFYSN